MIYVHSPTLILYYKIILLSKNLSTTVLYIYIYIYIYICWPLESSSKTPALTHAVYTGSSPLTCVFLLAFPNAGLHSFHTSVALLVSIPVVEEQLPCTSHSARNGAAKQHQEIIAWTLSYTTTLDLTSKPPPLTQHHRRLVFAHIHACPCFYVRLGGEWVLLNRFYCRTHSVLSANHFQSAQLSTSPFRMPLQPHNWNYLIGKLPSR